MPIAPDKLRDWPIKKYNILYVDPPWEIQRGPNNWRTNEDETWVGHGPDSHTTKSQALEYPTLPLDDIKALPVPAITEPDSHLYLWVINHFIAEAYSVAKVWGFRPVCLLTWIKPKHGIGLGGAFIQTTEHLLFCRRGTLPTLSRYPSTWFHFQRSKHSEKPNAFRGLIETISGKLPRIELFARQRYEGWDAWGNELPEE